MLNRLIAVDWGTSSLRIFLMEDGKIVEQLSAAKGIMQVERADYPVIFHQLVAPWREKYGNLPAIACGMIGSAQGWRQVGYCPCPADVESLSRQLGFIEEHDFYIIPGVECAEPLPNVMRGEETQIIGAMAANAALFEHALLLMPGTHSKWVPIENGKIQPFQTFMTGELYAVLSRHSILGRPAQEASEAGSEEESRAAFTQGVECALEAREGIAAQLFSVRTLVLRQQLAAASSLDYLSGLLIGDELRCGLKTYAAPSAIIADAVLAEKYRYALQLAGIDRVKIINNAAPLGLWHIAQKFFSRKGDDV